MRKDAQLAREVEFAIPREMDQVQGISLARDFVQREFVDKGMIADLNVHWDIIADGEAKPHAHVMLTMREVGEEGFGGKVRDWNSTALLQQWREAWAARANERMAELGIEVRIDHRSYEAQGIELEPQDKIGPAGARRLERGEDADRAAEHVEIAGRNGEKIIASPQIGLDAISHQQSTFTVRDMAKMAHRHSDDSQQFNKVLGAMKTSEQLVALGRDGRGNERFTTRGMIGSRQMERVLKEAERGGTKVVLVGDAQQLQAIEAGAAFRALAERHGAVEITEIRRQREGWQRDATRQLATGRTGEALSAQGLLR